MWHLKFGVTEVESESISEAILWISETVGNSNNLCVTLHWMATDSNNVLYVKTARKNDLKFFITKYIW